MNRNSKSYVRFTMVIATLLVLLTFAAAQSIVSGDLTGTVTDPSGAVVPGATVTLKNSDNGSSQTVTTNNAGVYRFALLKPGRYTVSVNQSGFAATNTAAFVAVGQITRADVKLNVTQSSQTVEVTAETPLVQTDNGNVQSSFNTAQIEALPNPGGDITYVAQQAPGVAINTAGGYGNFTADGTPANSNLFTVNGNDEMDPYLNLNNSGASNLTLGANELAEATVTTNGYTGEFGRNAGAQVNYATKSGTNQFHGNALYYWTGAALNARDWFANGDPADGFSANPNPNSSAHQWAGSVGGPIWKDKTFFFVNTEGLRYKLPSSQLVSIPSAAAQATALGIAAGDPATTALYQRAFGIYNAAPGAAGAVVDPTDPTVATFRSLATNTAHEWMLTARVDHQFSAADRVFFRYKTDHGTQPTFTDPLSPVFNAESVQPSHEGQINWSHTFGNSIVNQFIGSGSYYSAIFKSVNQAAATQLFPFNLFTDIYTPIGGENEVFPQGRNVTQYQLVDDLSVTKGNHTMKFGVNYKRNDISDFFFSELNTTPEMYFPDFTYTNAAGQAAAFSFRQRFPLANSQPLALYSFGFYGQDQWKVNSHLNFTFALRGDHNSNPVCQTDCFARPNDGFSQLTVGPTVPYNQTIQTGLHQAYPSLEAVTWQPRLGFAITPFGNSTTAIRGGFGIFSDLPPGTLAERFARNPPTLSDFTLANCPVSQCATQAQGVNQTFLNQFNSGGNYNTVNAALSPILGAPFLGLNLNSIYNNVKNPKWFKWNLELDQSFGTKTSVSINYVGDHGRDLFIINPGLNANCASTRCAGFTGFGATSPDPSFATVSNVYNGGISNYNGVTVSVNRRYSQLQFGANYTWSHTLDDVSNGGLLPYGSDTTALGQINPFCLTCNNYSNSDYDIRHYFSANYTWTPKYKFNSGLLDQVLGGWQLSETFFLRSGTPFTAFRSSSSFFGAGSNFTGSQIPFVIAGGPTDCGRATPTSNTCLDPANFTAPTSFTDVGRRNTLRGPSFFDSDINLMKNFKMTERLGLGIGANLFNVFNHPNFGNPVGNVTSSQFGQIVNTVSIPTSPYGTFVGAAASGRTIQLEGKLTF
jgi:Carboxypeptidase regulatory-like domain